MKQESSLTPHSPRSQSEISRASAGHEWNNGITRRSFLKRTGGATLATMVSWHSSTAKSHAEEGGVSGESDEYYWDMKCTAPPVSLSGAPSQSAAVAVTFPFMADFDLILGTNKSADAGCYGSASVQHSFALNMTFEDAISTLPGHNAFSIFCDRLNGLISSTFDASSSSPLNETMLTRSFFLGEDFQIVLSIWVIRDFGASDVTTRVFGAIEWIYKKDPEDPVLNGSQRIPNTPGSSLVISNSFDSHKHKKR